MDDGPRLAPAVVFDLGGVLVDWDPRHVYRPLFDDEAEMERFLREICTPAWNLEQDRGRTLAEATSLLQAEHPDHADLIAAYYGRWSEMIGGLIDGTVEIASRLHADGVPLYALTNWSAETFPLVRPALTFLDEFAGIVLSGEEGVVKPDPKIFEVLEDRFDLTPGEAIYVDDQPANVAAAKDRGYDALHFTTSDRLHSDLRARGLLGGHPDDRP